MGQERVNSNSGITNILLLFIGLGVFTMVALLLFDQFSPFFKSLAPQQTIPPTTLNSKIIKNVALVTVDPKDESGIGIISKYGWKNPEDLSSQYINTIYDVSGGLVSYVITKRISYDLFPTKKDGFTLDHEYYPKCLQVADENCHRLINYGKFFNELSLCQDIADGKINEIWAFAGPWLGMWEWSVKGPKISSLSENLPSCGNNSYTIMAFSPERSLAEMLEDTGHRFEAVMSQIPFSKQEYWEWKNFTSHSVCGSVHIPPNGIKDYDWDNTSESESSCDSYLNYPNLSEEKKLISCKIWGCTGEGYLKWWLSHIPKEWWSLVVDTDNSL